MTKTAATATCPACGNAVEALPPGRPSDLSPALAERMAELISDGYSKVSMCRVVGVPQRTFYDWQRRARDGVEPYATLMWEVAKAEEAYIHEVESEVRRATNLRGFPDAAGRIAFLKSRREEWTTRVKLENAKAEVLQELLESLPPLIPGHIFDKYVSPALLRLAGAPVELPTLIEADGLEVSTEVG